MYVQWRVFIRESNLYCAHVSSQRLSAIHSTVISFLFDVEIRYLLAEYHGIMFYSRYVCSSRLTMPILYKRGK